MSNMIIVTTDNVDRVKDWQDTLSMETFKVGDIIVRCANCGAVLHQGYVSRLCPVCREIFLPSNVHTSALHLVNYQQREGKTSKPNKNADSLKRSKKVSNILLTISIIGLLLTLWGFASHDQRAQVLLNLRNLVDHPKVVDFLRTSNDLMKQVILVVNCALEHLLVKCTILLEYVKQLFSKIWVAFDAMVTTFANTPIQQWLNVFFSIFGN